MKDLICTVLDESYVYIYTSSPKDIANLPALSWSTGQGLLIHSASMIALLGLKEDGIRVLISSSVMSPIFSGIEQASGLTVILCPVCHYRVEQEA